MTRERRTDMKLKLKVVTLCLLLTVLSGLFSLLRTEAEQPARYGADEIYAKSSSSIVYVCNLSDYGTVRSVGTGVIVSEHGLVLTAYHVVSVAGSLEAVLQDGRTIADVQVEAYDEADDLALLKLPASGKSERYKALPIHSGIVKSGEQVFAIGYPLKGTPVITQGIVNSPDADINGRSRILTSAQIVSGMSGGPLIDRQGFVVGLISGSLRTMPGIHLVVGMDKAALMLKAGTAAAHQTDSRKPSNQASRNS